LLSQPMLSKTLGVIASSGADALYEGQIAARLTSYIQYAGGVLSVEDMKRFSPIWVDPLLTTYRGYDVAAMPPNSFGVLMLMQLQSLAALQSGTLNSDAISRMRWQIRAMRASFDVGLPEIGDPSFMKVNGEDLISDSTIAAVRDRMLRGYLGAQPGPTGGTACVTVADAKGNAVCVVQSIFNPFGAHFLDPNTGIVLNNRMFGFDHTPGRVNSVAPGKRPAHTLNPVMVMRNGHLRWVYASPGGISQTITGTQILVNLIERQLDIAAAINEGRWAVDRGGNVLIEPRVPPNVLQGLNDEGIPAKLEEDAYLFGSATVIQRDADDQLRAAGDMRREACAMAH
jgi:gamma-glutamyltranspeptidase/glutathione hydrolase